MHTSNVKAGSQEEDDVRDPASRAAVAGEEVTCDRSAADEDVEVEDIVAGDAEAVSSASLETGVSTFPSPVFAVG